MGPGSARSRCEMAWASVSLYLCGLCASRNKWWRDIALILTIAIVATTMVMMVMVVVANNIDHGGDAANGDNGDRSIS